MKAIIYESLTGHTAQYAKMLAEETGLPCFSVKEMEKVPKGADVIFMGWLMAGTVSGIKQAIYRFNVAAVCAVGLDASEENRARLATGLGRDGTPIFLLQGGIAMDKLKGPRKLILKAVTSAIAASLRKKPSRTPEDEDMLRLLTEGGSRVKRENLAPVIDWCKTF